MSNLYRYLTDEVVEGAAKAMADDWDPERSPILAAMFRDYAQTALEDAAPDIIRRAKEEAWDEALQARASWMQDQRYYAEDEIPNPYRIKESNDD